MEMAGGYRLVRKLGEGARSTVFLGRAAGDEPTESVAIKVFRAGVNANDIDAEIEALARSSHRHLAELLDLALMPDGRPCLILRRLGNTSLAALIADSGAVARGLGEVVTALVPIARALGELHRVGIAHGKVCAESILLDELGAPVLIGFGHARVVGPVPVGAMSSLTPAQLASDPFIRADIVAFARLAKRMLTAVGNPDKPGAVEPGAVEPGAVPQLIRWLEQLVAGEGLSADAEGIELTTLADRLFELAPAAEIRVTSAALSPGERAVPGVGTEWAPAEAAADPENRSAPAMRIGAMPIRAKRMLPAGLLSALDPTIEMLGGILDGDMMTRARSRLAAALAPVRRPVWIIGGIGIVALLCGIVVVPSARGSDGVPVPVRMVTAAPQSAAPKLRPSSSADPSPSGSSSSSAKPAPETAIIGDDPVLAAVALTQKRQGCLDSGSVSCLGAVDQAGSAAEDADRGSVRDIRAASSRRERTALLKAAAMTDAVFVLTQTMGDTAILSVTADQTTAPTTTASVLMIRTEAGWRFRDLLLGG